MVNILSAKIKALKILDRNSIWLILPIDDDQKIALFFCSVLHVTSNIIYLLQSFYYFFSSKKNYILFLNEMMRLIKISKKKTTTHPSYDNHFTNISACGV